MSIKISIVSAVAGATLLVAVPAAWGKGQPYRDAGDATAAKLATLQSSPMVVRDAGDATAAKLATFQSSQIVARDSGDAMAARASKESTPSIAGGSSSVLHWSSVGVVLGIVTALVLCVIATVRLARSHRLAH
jgi:hypothetical protein